MTLRTVKVHVYGRVQGVFFRYHTQLEAQRRGIQGWVKNCNDGSVETLIYGSEDAIREMIAWLRQGPESAQVKEIVVDDTHQGQNHPQSFEILY